MANNEASDLSRRRRNFNLEEALNFVLESENDYSDSDTTSSDDLVSSETEEEVILDEKQPADLGFVDYDVPDMDDVQQQNIPVEPTGPFVAQWIKEAPEQCKIEEFIGFPSVSEQINSNEPLKVFECFFTEELCELIANQTNLYAEQFMEGKTFNQSSRFLKWTPVTINEIKVYIALVLYL